MSGCSGPNCCSLIARARWYKRLGLLVLALRMVECGQVVEAGGRVRMLWPQLLLTDRQGALVQRLGLLVLALRIVECGQVVEAGGRVRMLWPQLLLSDRQGTLRTTARPARTCPAHGRVRPGC